MLRLLAYLFAAGMLLAVAGAGAVVFGVWHYGRTLPEHHQLADYEPPVTTRVHAADGRLIAEFAQEQRLFVPIEAIPEHVKHAFLSAEDKTFYEHPGVDFLGIASAAVANLRNLGSDRRPIGASTITQQVAKNFLLTNEVSIERKIKEALLAFRIEQAFSKDRILELYLNEIYLGQRSYGVAAAALNYFDKALDELTVAEAAYLAALPKAPNNYHPTRRIEAALQRRNWVLGRMTEDGWIDEAGRDAARAEPLGYRPQDTLQTVDARYFAEEIRRELAGRFGEPALYQGGLSVRSSLEPRLQEAARRSLRDGLEDYDRRHGWRGPIARIEPAGDWQAALNAVEVPRGIGDWRIAAVLEVGATQARIGLDDGTTGVVPWAEMRWARPWLEGQRVGAAPNRPADVLAPGDVVAVTPQPANAKDRVDGGFRLRQIPEIEGALVAMDPHTGRVLAMAGGWSFAESQFNRATQAKRQPGSAFKPFVYAAALEDGFMPTSMVLDAPFVLDQGPVQGKWKPENYSQEFYGPSTLRLGIEKSRNLMTVRLAQHIGMPKVVEIARRFDVVDGLQPYLPMALGAGETTVMRLTAAYGMLVNGGRRIVPTLIDRIQDRHGRTVFRHDDRPCPGCSGSGWQRQAEPAVPDERDQVIDPATAYQMVSMLEGAVLRGTGMRIREVGKPLAGKTGTTNDARDAWFVGFSPDLAVGVWTGFDEPLPLGPRETGSSIAVPIFRDFMAAALENASATPFRVPPGIRLMRVDARTGEPVDHDGRGVILEAFKAGVVPNVDRLVLDGTGDRGFAGGASADIGGVGGDSGNTPRTGTGGLY